MPYIDSFDFLSTRLDPNTSIFSQDLPKFLPTIPADFRTVDSSGAQGTNPNAVFDLLGQKLNNLPDNLPAYQYTAQQERRYNNPYLQYTPSNVLGTDAEDIYGRFQGPGEQLWNSLVKFGANTAGTFASSFLTIPGTIDLVREGKYIEAFENDYLFPWIQEALTAIEDKFPNYYTSLERSRSDWVNAFSPTGAMNFWGDKVIKNIGFSMGGLASGLVVDSAINLITAGTASPVTFIAAANQFQKGYKNLFRGFRNLVKGSENIDNVIDAAKVTNNLSKGLEISTLSRVGTIGKFAGINYLSAQGEAFIEGYHTYIDTKKQLLEEAISRGETDPETLSEIEKRAQDAGRWTAGLNIPLLLVSNMLQFPNLLNGKSMLAATNSFIKTELGEEGLKAVSDFTTKKAIGKWAKETFKDVFAEGLEEGSQYHISNSLHDYYADRLNPKAKEGVLAFLFDNVPETLTDDQFWSEAGIGALTGALMGAPATVPTIFNGKSRTDKLVNHLNETYQRFNSTVKQYQKAIDLSNDNLTERDAQISANDALFAAVHDSIKFGTFENLIDSLNDLKDVDINQYNQAFGTDFQSTIERDQHLNDMISDANEIYSSIRKVEQFYPNNPYTKPYLTRKIQNALSPKSQTELNSVQENLFNDFKEVVARNQFMLKKTKGQLLKYKNELESLGVKDEAINYLGNLAHSRLGFKSYVDWKKSQIKDLKKQVQYYDALGQTQQPLTPEVKPKEELKKYEQLLKDTEEYLETIVEVYNKYEKSKRKEDYDLFIGLILGEETNEGQRNRFKENVKKKVEGFQETTQDVNKLEKEEEDLTSEEPKTAEGLLDANLKVAEESIPHPDPTPVPEPVVDPNEWLKKFSIGDVTPKGKTVKSIQEDHMIAVDDIGNEYKVFKENGKIKEEPNGVTVPPAEITQKSSKTFNSVEEIEKARNKELVQARPNNLDLDSNGNLIEKVVMPKGEFDFTNAFSGGINQTYQQIYDALINGTDIIAGLKDNNVIKLRPLYNEGKIKSKIDVYHRLSEPEINKKYDKLIDDFIQKQPEVAKQTTEEQPLVTSGVEEQESIQEPQLEEVQEPVAVQVQTKLQVGTEEFTPSEIFNYPNVIWLKKGTGLIEGTKVYSLEDGFIYRRTLAESPQGLTIGKSRSKIKASNVKELGNFYIKENDTFVQVLRDEEQIVTKDKLKPSDEDKNLNDFLGEYKQLKPIFQQQINRGKFELICK